MWIICIKKLDVEIVIFYEILIIVCAINFEIVFWRNSNNVDYFNGIYAKFRKKLSNIIKKNISIVL